MAGAAIIANYRATQAVCRHPALGRFVISGDARLHYIEQGRGPAVVFLHGNGAMGGRLSDHLISGFFTRVAQRYRAIAI